MRILEVLWTVALQLNPYGCIWHYPPASLRFIGCPIVPERQAEGKKKKKEEGTMGADMREKKSADNCSHLVGGETVSDSPIAIT